MHRWLVPLFLLLSACGGATATTAASTTPTTTQRPEDRVLLRIHAEAGQHYDMRGETIVQFLAAPTHVASGGEVVVESVDPSGPTFTLATTLSDLRMIDASGASLPMPGTADLSGLVARRTVDDHGRPIGDVAISGARPETAPLVDLLRQAIDGCVAKLPDAAVGPGDHWEDRNETPLSFGGLSMTLSCVVDYRLDEVRAGTTGRVAVIAFEGTCTSDPIPLPGGQQGSMEIEGISHGTMELAVDDALRSHTRSEGATRVSSGDGPVLEMQTTTESWVGDPL